jgi:hypothetical protein
MVLLNRFGGKICAYAMVNIRNHVNTYMEANLGNDKVTSFNHVVINPFEWMRDRISNLQLVQFDWKYRYRA